MAIIIISCIFHWILGIHETHLISIDEPLFLPLFFRSTNSIQGRKLLGVHWGCTRLCWILHWGCHFAFIDFHNSILDSGVRDAQDRPCSQGADYGKEDIDCCRFRYLQGSGRLLVLLPNVIQLPLTVLAAERLGVVPVVVVCSNYSYSSIDFWSITLKIASESDLDFSRASLWDSRGSEANCHRHSWWILSRLEFFVTIFENNIHKPRKDVVRNEDAVGWSDQGEQGTIDNDESAIGMKKFSLHFEWFLFSFVRQHE